MARTKQEVKQWNVLVDDLFKADAEHPFLAQTVEPQAKSLATDLSAVAAVLKYADDEARDDHGRWTSGSGSASTSPKEVCDVMVKGKDVTVSKHDLRAVVEHAADRDDHPDLTNLTVEGTAIYSGGLGLSRIQMPQIPSEHREAYMESVERLGIKVKAENVSPLSLLPTQNQIDATKVGQMLGKADDGKMPEAIFVSKDNYVLDGHHRWAMETVRQIDGDSKLKMPVLRIMADHKKALDTMYDYDKKHGIAAKPHGKLARIWYGKDWTE